MSILTGVKLELFKLRHTRFWLLHMLLICGVTALLAGYYMLYASREAIVRIRMVYEFIAILIPVFSSLSVAFLVRMEEQISNMYGILAVRHRKKVIIGILLLSWSVTVLQLLLQTISLAAFGKLDGVAVSKVLLLCGGMIIFSFFFHVFHLFLHLRFGIGVSMLWGVFECMQSVMYSNIELANGFRYIPSAWLMEWKACIFGEKLREQWGFWAVSLVLLLSYLFLFLIWFEHWEGKKNDAE